MFCDRLEKIRSYIKDLPERERIETILLGIAESEEYSALFEYHLQNLDLPLPWKTPGWNLAFLLAGAADAEIKYKEWGWSDAMFRGLLRDIFIWMEHCRINDHKLGVAGTGWNVAQLKGEIIRLGRLQCNMKAGLFSHLRIYRHKITGEYRGAVCKKMDFIAKGYPALPGEDAAFTTEDNVDYPVLPDGSVSSEKQVFGEDEWELAVNPRDPVICLHIPADGPLKMEDVYDSMRQMKEFFEKRNYGSKGFVCESWILDPQFREILPPESNLLAFQNLGLRLPFPEDSEAIFRVFGRHPVLKKTPESTSMQRAFLDFMAQGGKFRNGALWCPMDW